MEGFNDAIGFSDDAFVIFTDSSFLAREFSLGLALAKFLSPSIAVSS